MLTAIAVPEMMMRMPVKGPQVTLLSSDLLNAVVVAPLVRVGRGKRGEGAVRGR